MSIARSRSWNGLTAKLYARRVQSCFEDLLRMDILAPNDDGPIQTANRESFRKLAIRRFLEAPSVDEDEPDIQRYGDLNPDLPQPKEDHNLPEEDIEPQPSAELYRDFIVTSPAYHWLLASLKRESITTRSSPDVMKGIRETILGALPSSHQVTRRAATQEYQATFEIYWDPISFVIEQEYTEDPDVALGRAITLTGSQNDGQALTSRQYLCQTWPATGEDMMRLIKDVVENYDDHRASCKCIVRGHRIFFLPETTR